MLTTIEYNLKEKITTEEVDIINTIFNKLLPFFPVNINVINGKICDFIVRFKHENYLHKFTIHTLYNSDKSKIMSDFDYNKIGCYQINHDMSPHEFSYKCFLLIVKYVVNEKIDIGLYSKNDNWDNIMLFLGMNNELLKYNDYGGIFDFLIINEGRIDIDYKILEKI
jgi:hypothetical protein